MKSGYEDRFMGFLLGVGTISIIFTIILVLVFRSPKYEYIDIDSLTCLEVNGQVVSCNWDN